LLGVDSIHFILLRLGQALGEYLLKSSRRPWQD